MGCSSSSSASPVPSAPSKGSSPKIPTQVKSSSEIPLSTQWRVRNAMSIRDHWIIGELEFFNADGKSTHNLIQRVACSHNYDNHNLAVVHNGKWSTGPGARSDVWAGSDNRSGKARGGSWLGYVFSTPQKIGGVKMAQSSAGSQFCGNVWLEAFVRNEWITVATLQFDSTVQHVALPSASIVAGTIVESNDNNENNELI